ncbi:hypothetical protein H6G04_31245 [Calothrix membranacea FACHB-236]|nr:hypothetical protein [Calothrix membranacea FACHB-236]
MLQRLSALVVVTLLLTQIALPVTAGNVSATVISVGDGDTIRVKAANKTLGVNSRQQG